MSSFSTGLYGSTISSIVNNVKTLSAARPAASMSAACVSELMQVERQPEAQMQHQQSTINSQVSALTSISTQLTALYDSVNNLKDIFGAFSQNTTGSSDAAIVSATADSTAAAGTHTITVSKLATISSSYSDYIAFGHVVGGRADCHQLRQRSRASRRRPTPSTFPVDAIPRCRQAASYINSGSLRGDRQRGNRFAGFAAGAGQQDFRGATAISPSAARPPTSPASAGVDAQLTVDGVPVDSSTNTVTGAIRRSDPQPGRADPDTPVLISVQPDTTRRRRRSRICRLLTTPSSVASTASTRWTPAATKACWRATACCVLCRVSLLGQVSALRSAASGQYVNLQSMGIEMQDDGTLQINSANLSQALSNNFSDVQKFFQSTRRRVGPDGGHADVADDRSDAGAGRRGHQRPESDQPGP